MFTIKMNITLLQIDHNMSEIHITMLQIPLSLKLMVEGALRDGGGMEPPSTVLPVLLLKYHLLLYYYPEITGV